jgi:hypothetical protein
MNEIFYLCLQVFIGTLAIFVDVKMSMLFDTMSQISHSNASNLNVVMIMQFERVSDYVI